MAENPVKILSGNPSLAELEKFTAEQQAKGRLIIGYLSYDYGCGLRGVKLSDKPALKTPAAWLAAFDKWDKFEPVGKPSNNDVRLDLQPTASRQAYGEAFRKIQNYIAAGDVYQINLTHQLEGSTQHDGRQLFDVLAASSRSEFQAYLEIDGFEIVSQSPERFIKIGGREITTMPIKGTRPRGRTATDDQALKAALLNSPKDQAELNMITDLMRNDLGEVCLPGSVRVAETRVLTAYPTLWHAHSTIAGRLRDDVSPIAALASVLPGGSITGCPKKRAMEIIDELEPVRRGVYTGTIFTISPNGELDSSIAIRTLIKQDDKIYLSVGGGIVYDSDEADEYQESLDKAASFTGSLSSDKDM
jgi:para-aminobenzoate synthetase component 1